MLVENNKILSLSLVVKIIIVIDSYTNDFMKSCRYLRQSHHLEYRLNNQTYNIESIEKSILFCFLKKRME